MIVVTGSEMLEGAYADGHTLFLTRTLRPLGCQCVGSLTVHDHPDGLKQALAFATQHAPVVLVTGGLGPTPNDITRETLAEYTGLELREHPEVLAELERRLKTPRDQLRPNLRRQTQVPVRGTYLKNANGTAVGLVFDRGESFIVALPGPPRELQPMVRDELVPFLQRRFGVRPWGRTLTLRFVGAGQSLIDQTLHDRVTLPPDLTVSSAFEGSRVDFTFALPGNSPADEARLRDLARQVRQHLGDYLYSDDGSSLEDQVGRGLQARGATLALAEVGSGGRLAEALSAVAGAERWLAGAYAAPTEARLAGLLALPVTTPVDPTGAQRAAALANRVAELTQAAWVIAVGEVRAPHGAAPQIWVAVRSPDSQTRTQSLAARESGPAARAQLVTQVLDQLRRQLK
jgi:nicotinamide-nucleotide amidase